MVFDLKAEIIHKRGLKKEKTALMQTKSYKNAVFYVKKVIF